MRRLILQEWLSLDGFTVDANGSLDFFPASETDHTFDRNQLRFLDRIDAILLGRKTYELFVDFWPTAASDGSWVDPRDRKPWEKFGPS
jgi:dihydrofolate reductase